MTTTFSDGAQVEVGMFGYESIIGISGLMGTKRSLHRVYTQIPGHGYSCLLETAHREFHLGGSFQALALRYVQAQLVQVTQSAGCNAQYDVDQRLARWLLICADRAHSTTLQNVPRISFLYARKLPTVSLRGGWHAERTRVIEYSRGLIHIPDLNDWKQRLASATHEEVRYLLAVRP